MLPDDAALPALALLRERARDIRRLALQMVCLAGVGQVGEALAMADLLAALYVQALRVDPASPHAPARDHLVLAAGAAAPALYAALALRGFFPVPELATFARLDSRLQLFPDVRRLPGLDGSEGLAEAVGLALGARKAGRHPMTYVLLDEAETARGQVWEMARVAARERLDHLVAIVACHGQQPFGAPGPSRHLYQQFEAFGWRVHEVPGNDMAALLAVLRKAAHPDGRPVAIVADTVLGCGVPFMEDDAAWRTRVPDARELTAALAVLGGDLALAPAARDLRYELPHAQRPNMPSTQRLHVAKHPRPRTFEAALAELGARHADVVVLADGDAALAMGMAAAGLAPWVVTSAFRLPAMGPIARSQANVKLVGTGAGVPTGHGGKAMAAMTDLAAMRAVPELVVVAPADGQETALALEALYDMAAPAYLRLPRADARALFDEHHVFKLGAGVLLRDGHDLAILSTGCQTARALAVADRLVERGLAVTVLHLPTVKPLDEAGVLAAARACGRVLVTEEHARAGGLGSAVAELLAEQHPVPVVRHGLADGYLESAPEAALRERYGLGVERLEALALELIQR